MLRAQRKVHINTSSVTLESEEFQVSSPFAGRTVEVRWHPDYLDAIEIWQDGNFLEIAPRISQGLSRFSFSGSLQSHLLGARSAWYWSHLPVVLSSWLAL
jgi:hypothetical protein